MSWGFGRQSPDNNLIRFVSRRFQRPSIFLDIGSGEGANARELWERGHAVVTVDLDPHTEPDWVGDIRKYDTPTRFNCIYDVNTLCHVKDPPIKKLMGLLRPGGIFFSICPTERTWRGVADGKDYTRFATHSDLRSMFNDFSYEIYETFCPDFRGNYLESWIVEATASKSNDITAREPKSAL